MLSLSWDTRPHEVSATTLDEFIEQNKGVHLFFIGATLLAYAIDDKWSIEITNAIHDRLVLKGNATTVHVNPMYDQDYLDEDVWGTQYVGEVPEPLDLFAGIEEGEDIEVSNFDDYRRMVVEFIQTAGEQYLDRALEIDLKRSGRA